VDDFNAPWGDVIAAHISFNQGGLLADRPGAWALGDGSIPYEMCLEACQVAHCRQLRP
jgi:hypothetical protein